jgi:hypothetical protein
LAGNLGGVGAVGDKQHQMECFDLLLDSGANESLLDVERYTPINFHRSPQLLDMRQIRGLNRCQCQWQEYYKCKNPHFAVPIRPGDHFDQLIAERDVQALRQIVLSESKKLVTKIHLFDYLFRR